MQEWKRESSESMSTRWQSAGSSTNGLQSKQSRSGMPLKEGELESVSVVKEYLTTAADGKNYRTKHDSFFYKSRKVRYACSDFH